jgi:hypothetical protein
VFVVMMMMMMMVVEDYRIKAATNFFTAFVARIMETPFRTLRKFDSARVRLPYKKPIRSM